MPGQIDQRLEALGITLPSPTAPVANYVPYTIADRTVFVAGQIPMINGHVHGVGRLGADLSIEEGQELARVCAMNLLAQARAAAGGDLDQIARVLKLGGFVCCTPDFTDHSAVINGASDLMVEVFGDIGRHARFAVGAPSLPRGVAVEVEAIFLLR
ncbi:MAG: RidA family protein [Myxococcota bacterium]